MVIHPQKEYLMRLSVLPGTFAVCRFSPKQEVPRWVWTDKTLLSITYTKDELSIVCSSALVPTGVQCEKEWVVMKVQGPLDFSLTGILAALATPLAEGGIAIFAISTFDTDYLLVKEQDALRAKELLVSNGHVFE
jgi:uncharacterized protein